MNTINIPFQIMLVYLQEVLNLTIGCVERVIGGGFNVVNTDILFLTFGLLLLSKPHIQFIQILVDFVFDGLALKLGWDWWRLRLIWLQPSPDSRSCDRARKR